MSSLTFRTTPPPAYIPPGREEMREIAKSVGLKGFAPDLLADLCNLAAGGSLTAPSSYNDIVRRKVEENLPSPDSQGDWKLPKSGGYTKDRQKVITAKVREMMNYHQNVQDFLDTVKLDRFPGGTPLEQACSLLKLLATKDGGTPSSGSDGEPLPIFTDDDSRPEGVAKELHEAIDLVDSLEGEELDMLDPDGNFSVEEQDGVESGHKSLNRLKVAEDLVAGSDKRVMLDISRKLDQFTKLQVRRQKKVETDPAGEEIRQRPIQNLGELSRVSPSAWATRQQAPGYFLYQAVSGQLPVRERVTRIERRQAIFILVDGSGSMSGQKHWKATGVVMNRLKAVISGDAEVYLSVFDDNLGDVHRASSPEEARNLIRQFANNNFSGGGTNIAAAVKAAHNFIEEKINGGASLYRPEIVVLTDEDSSISGLVKSKIAGTRVHGFAMDVANPSLVAFARSTGGVGVEKF